MKTFKIVYYEERKFEVTLRASDDVSARYLFEKHRHFDKKEVGEAEIEIEKVVETQDKPDLEKQLN